MALSEAGLSIFSTLDAGFQRAAESAVSKGLAELERRQPRLSRGKTRPEAALVALDPLTGDVLALVGGRDAARSSFNRAVSARRQPGSLMKPIVAAAALSRDGNDHLLTLASVLADEPLEVAVPEGLWRPVNFDGRHRGAVTLRDALEQSLNVPFARLGLEVGLVRVVETARRFGLARRAAARALGLARRLRGVAARDHGRVHRLRRRAAGAPGRATRSRCSSPTAACARARTCAASACSRRPRRTSWSRRCAAWWSAAPRARCATSACARPSRARRAPRDGERDAWFIGFTPDLVVGVWVGFDGDTKLGLTGAEAALPIFAAFAEGALARALPEPFALPKRVDVVEIDPRTGLRAGPGCRGQDEIFLRGTAPTKRCARDPWAFLRELDSSRKRAPEPIALGCPRRCHEEPVLGGGQGGAGDGRVARDRAHDRARPGRERRAHAT